MIERNFNLHLTAGHSTALVINVNQFDQGEKWIFTLYNENGTQYIPSTGAIVGIKSDGLGIINSGSVVDGKVVIMETEQMTAAVGKAVFELMIDSQTHGTANFIVLVEPKPGNNADLSESDLSLLQEAIDATSPLPTGGTVGQVLTKTANGSTWSNAGTPTQEQVANAVSDWADEHITVETGVVIDTSLSVAGAAADAKKTGDEITDLKSEISSLSSVPTAVKNAIDTLFQNVAFKNDDVYTDEIAVVHNWATAVNLLSISAIYTQSGTVYDNASLDSLKNDLVVTASYDNGTTATVNDYTLSGELTEGTSTITVIYNGKTTSFVVTVTHTDNMFNPTTAPVINAYINATTNKLESTASVNYETAYIQIQAGKTYKITKSATNIFRVGTTNTTPAVDVTVLQTKANHTGTEITITADSTANYLAITYWNSGTEYDANAVKNSITVNEVFANYSGGISLSKSQSTSNPSNVVYRNNASGTARACMDTPILNNNYVFTSADTSKYQLCAYDIQDLNPVTLPSSWTSGMDGYGYQGGSKSVSWVNSDSVTTDYVWVSFKKLDNTDFTNEELANMEGTVFTYTEGA